MKLGSSYIRRTVLTVSILACFALSQDGVLCCPSIAPQAIFGSGSCSKLGFTPCLGECPLHYYLAQNTGEGVEFSDVTSFPPDSGITISESVSGTRTQIDPDRDVFGSPCQTSCCSSAYTYYSWTYYTRMYHSWFYLGDSGESVCESVDGVPGDCTVISSCGGLPLVESSNSTNCVEQVQKNVHSLHETSYDPIYGVSSHNQDCTSRIGTWYSDEYTTEKLVKKIQTIANANLPADFPGDEPSGNDVPSGSFTLRASEDNGTASVCRWRAKITGTEKNRRYTISYYKNETTITHGVKTESSTLIAIKVTAPAETWWYSDGQILKASQVLGDCPTSSDGVHSIQYVGFDIQPADDAPPPGSGGPGCGGGAGGARGGCASCGSGPAAKCPPGPSFVIAMGWAGNGGSAGEFSIAATTPSLELAKTSTLQFSGQTDPTAGVTVVQDYFGNPQTVQTPLVTATVIPTSPFSYQVNITNNYDLTVVANWTIENPDASTNMFNKLKITQLLPNNDTRVWLYIYDSASGFWTLTPPGNLAAAKLKQSTDAASGTRTETTQYTTPGGVVVSEETRVYASYSWGEALLSDTVGSGPDAKTTQYSYYANSTEAGFVPTANRPPLKQIVRPDGTWDYYASYDSQGRPLLVLSGIDTAPTTTAALCRSLEYSYTPVDANDTGTIEPRTPRTMTEKFKGTRVSRTYVVLQPGMRTELRCLNAAATYAQANSDANTQITTTSYYTDDQNQGRVWKVANPDGTMRIHQYVDYGSSQTTTVSVGKPNQSGSGIDQGTQTVTEVDYLGQLISVTSRDISSGVAGTILSTQVYSNPDNLGRPQRVTFLDGTSEQTIYGCCGIESTTDRDGLQAQIEYDAMRRVLGRTIVSYPLPLSLTNVLDAAGRITASVRSAGGFGPSVSRQSLYDTSGFLTRETNALGGVTTYSETTDFGSSTRTRTVTFPDLGTRIEKYAADGSLIKLTGSAVHPVRYEFGVNTDISSPDYGNRYTKIIRLNTDPALTDTLEWTQTYTDALGRAYKTVFAPRPGIDDSAHPPYTQQFYNTKGQLWKERDADGVVTLYGYNDKGEREYTAKDLNSNGAIDLTGPDRITRVVRTIVPTDGIKPDLIQVDNFVWDDGQSVGTLVSRVQTSTDSAQSWQITWQQSGDPGISAVTQSSTLYEPADGRRTVTVNAPDGTQTVTVFTNGRPGSITHNDNTTAHNAVTETTFGYDAFGRRYTVTDSRNGTTQYIFNDADLVTIVSTPVPGVGQRQQRTTTLYDNCLRAWEVIQPDNTSVTNQFDLTGLITNTAGSRVFPVAYTFDYAGRMKTMTTWTNAGLKTGAATATWNYNPYRGWLDNKRYADNTGPDYTYTAAGRLATRAWARTNSLGARVLTTYTYGLTANTAHGDLTGVQYSNDPVGTAGLAYTYDRRGRQKTVVQGLTTSTLAYNDANQLLSEIFAGGTLDGLSVGDGYDGYLRRNSLVVKQSNTILVQNSMSYNNASRLQTVTDSSAAIPYSATYTYVENSSLVGQITFQQGASVRMTTTKQFDALNRLMQISSSPSGSATVGFNYTYNDANQRTAVRLNDGNYWRFGYDSLGEVTSGYKYFADQTLVAGQQFDYSFDSIGNRMQSRVGGDAGGNNQRVANYHANLLNQYTNRDVPGAVDVMGISLATNTVTVNGQVASRKGEYFRQQLNVNNSGSPVWTNITVSAPGQSSQSGNQFVPKTQEQFTYDLDGNLTSDGHWNYTWDAENRLLTLCANATVGPQISLRFEYDWKGRRIDKRVWSNTGWSGSPSSDSKFMYDGWNLVAELDALSNCRLLRSYLWGMDLSDSAESAGGIGGLLKVAYFGTSTTNCFVAFDGSGNVGALINATDGTSIAQYEYGPFGELLRATGPMAKANPLRFSTKYQDDETDLLYYSYRYYSASTGRWLGRDPLGEKAFYAYYLLDRGLTDKWSDTPAVENNCYRFVINSPIGNSDMDGCRMTPTGDIAVDDKNRRKAPGGMKLIKVPKCTILFIYGHNFVNNFEKEGLQWIWNIVPANDKEKDCSYAAVAGCSANLVPNEIPLPGFNYSDYDIGDQGTIKGTTLLQMWNDVRNTFAPSAAKGLTSCSCKCTKVTLMWTKIGGGLPDLKPDLGTEPLP